MAGRRRSGAHAQANLRDQACGKSVPENKAYGKPGVSHGACGVPVDVGFVDVVVPGVVESGPAEEVKTRRGAKLDKHPKSKATRKARAPASPSRAVEAVRTKVLELAMEAQGSREVQKALEEAGGAEQELIVRELKGHIGKLLSSPHGNHVIQKAISVMWPADMLFIVPELLQWGRPSTLARHNYGCRVLERLLEFFPRVWLLPFMDDIMDNVMDLCKHTYGNFVVQHLVEFHAEHRERIVALLRADLTNMCMNQNACGVVEKALTYALRQDQLAMIEQILGQDGLLVEMAAKRWGLATAERLLGLAKGAHAEEALNQISEGYTELQEVVSGKQLCDALFLEDGSLRMKAHRSSSSTASTSAESDETSDCHPANAPGLAVSAIERRLCNALVLD